MGKFSIRNETAILGALQHACGEGELLILVTPYLRFECSFLRLDEDAVHVTASMGPEDAMYGLRSAELRMRFPHGYSFVEGPTRLLGFGAVSSRKSLRLRIPESLEEDDHRSAYRVERLGRITTTFSTRRYALISASLVNLSTTGARIHSLRDFEEGEVAVDDTFTITIPLSEEIHINTKAKVRYIQARSVGLEFRPKLDGVVLERLSRWVFQHREEERDRMRPQDIVPAAAPGAPGTRFCLTLVSPSQELEDNLRGSLSGLPPLRRIPATGQALKDALSDDPALLLFHITGTGLEERRRLKALAEYLGGKWPFVLLGTGTISTADLFEIGNELKAASVYVLGPRSGTFFARLLQGILRRHYEGGEGPLAPKAPEES
ncbi:MAG TPA: PilZ domain-containing protein [Holophaga sp.]|nr:PilZ domain-containing protein [Holophaga sp.]